MFASTLTFFSKLKKYINLILEINTFIFSNLIYNLSII